MKLVKDKQIMVAADFAGLALKDAVVQHLKERGWGLRPSSVKTAPRFPAASANARALLKDASASLLNEMTAAADWKLRV